MDLEGITLSEKSQAEKGKYYMILLTCEIKKYKTKETHRNRDQISGEWKGW